MKKVVFAIEDDEDIRQLYDIALNSAGLEVECFENSTKLFSRLETKMPDIFLLDIMLDGLDGFEILNFLKSNSKTKNIPVIMVSAKNQELSKVKALDEGCDDYISKPFGIMELVARINANLRKYESNIPEVKKFIYKDIEIDDNIHEVKINKNKIQIALKLYDLLKILVINNDKLMTREVLFNQIWGTNAFLETRTLDMHISSLRKILSENNSDVTIETIRGVGFILK